MMFKPSSFFEPFDICIMKAKRFVSWKLHFSISFLHSSMYTSHLSKNLIIKFVFTFLISHLCNYLAFSSEYRLSLLHNSFYFSTLSFSAIKNKENLYFYFPSNFGNSSNHPGISSNSSWDSGGCTPLALFNQ